MGLRMKNAINIVTIILYVMELIRKYKMNKQEAANVTAQHFKIDLSEVLDIIAKYFKKKGLN